MCPLGTQQPTVPRLSPHSALRELRVPLSQAEEKTRGWDTQRRFCLPRKTTLPTQTQARRQRPTRLSDSSEGLKMAPVGEENQRETAQQTLAGSQTAPSSRLCPTPPHRHSRSAQAGSGARPQLRQPSAPQLGVSVARSYAGSWETEQASAPPSFSRCYLIVILSTFKRSPYGSAPFLY